MRSARELLDRLVLRGAAGHVAREPTCAATACDAIDECVDARNRAARELGRGDQRCRGERDEDPWARGRQAVAAMTARRYEQAGVCEVEAMLERRGDLRKPGIER